MRLIIIGLLSAVLGVVTTMLGFGWLTKNFEINPVGAIINIVGVLLIMLIFYGNIDE